MCRIKMKNLIAHIEQTLIHWHSQQKFVTQKKEINIDEQKEKRKHDNTVRKKVNSQV